MWFWGPTDWYTYWYNGNQLTWSQKIHISSFTFLSSNIKVIIFVLFYLHCLSHWGRVTHICISKLTIIVSDNGLSPNQRQAIIWANDGCNIVHWALGNELQWNLNRNLHIFIQENLFEKYRLENFGHFVSASMCYMLITPICSCVFMYAKVDCHYNAVQYNMVLHAVL